jgi:hypothetical protein
MSAQSFDVRRGSACLKREGTTKLYVTQERCCNFRFCYFPPPPFCCFWTSISIQFSWINELMYLKTVFFFRATNRTDSDYPSVFPKLFSLVLYIFIFVTYMIMVTISWKLKPGTPNNFRCRGMGAETKVVVCRVLKKAEQYINPVIINLHFVLFVSCSVVLVAGW